MTTDSAKLVSELRKDARLLRSMYGGEGVNVPMASRLDNAADWIERQSNGDSSATDEGEAVNENADRPTLMFWMIEAHRERMPGPHPRWLTNRDTQETTQNIADAVKWKDVFSAQVERRQLRGIGGDVSHKFIVTGHRWIEPRSAAPDGLSIAEPEKRVTNPVVNNGRSTSDDSSATGERHLFDVQPYIDEAKKRINVAVDDHIRQKLIELGWTPPAPQQRQADASAPAPNGGELAKQLIERASDIQASFDHVEWHGWPQAEKGDADLMHQAAAALESAGRGK